MAEAGGPVRESGDGNFGNFRSRDGGNGFLSPAHSSPPFSLSFRSCNAIIEPFGRVIARKTEPLGGDFYFHQHSPSTRKRGALPRNSCLCPVDSPPSFATNSHTMSWRQSSVHMERALLERCPNTLLRRRVSAGLKVQRMVSDLALPARGLRPLPTIPTPTTPPASSAARVVARVTTAAAPRYTSLVDMMPSECSSPIESVSSPRTPMRNQLVEKAARAYLLPSDSFNKSRLHASGQGSLSSGAVPWTQSFSRFLPRLSVITTALNPFLVFNSAFQVFRSYVTGARALQPAVATRVVSRSFSMPIQRMAYL